MPFTNGFFTAADAKPELEESQKKTVSLKLEKEELIKLIDQFKSLNSGAIDLAACKGILGQYHQDIKHRSDNIMQVLTDDKPSQILHEFSNLSCQLQSILKPNAYKKSEQTKYNSLALEFVDLCKRLPDQANGPAQHLAQPPTLPSAKAGGSTKENQTTSRQKASWCSCFGRIWSGFYQSLPSFSSSDKSAASSAKQNVRPV